MMTPFALMRLMLALLLAATFSSCATSRASLPERQAGQAQAATVHVTQLPGGQLQLDFPPLPPGPAHTPLREDEARSILAAFHEAFPETPPFEIVPAAASPAGAPRWELRLRAEFIGRYGASRLPMPESLQRSPLFMALKLSPRYMAPGFRDAARELFRSPVFIASVALSIIVYFSAWVLPEPIFSKAFAATLTARLAFAVGLIELRNVAMACLLLYREAQAARTLEDKNEIASSHGGPWTPLFRRIFAKAGMDLNDPANLVYLAGHQGPHPEAYHNEVYRTLLTAVARCRSVTDCRSKLIAALQSLARDVCTPGTRLHQLATARQE